MVRVREHDNLVADREEVGFGGHDAARSRPIGSPVGGHRKHRHPPKREGAIGIWIATTLWQRDPVPDHVRGSVPVWIRGHRLLVVEDEGGRCAVVTNQDGRGAPATPVVG